MSSSTTAAEFARWFVPTLLVLFAAVYGAGLARLWPHVHARRELIWRAVAFAAGWLVLAVALLSPLDALASGSFAVHAIQHELLILIAAPLLAVGRGLPTFIWALPHDARIALGHSTKVAWVRGSWNAITSAPAAWLLYAAALWVWHVPAFFNAAVADPALHDWQHASFLVAGLLFWHALLRPAGHNPRNVALVYLFTTALQTGVLGALITFADRPWYTTLDAGLRVASFTSLEDQRLGGLIIWVAGTLVYVGVALTCAAHALRSPREESAR